MVFLSISVILSIFFIQNPVNPIIINEVLFNPRAGGVDFVELYNPSPVPVNLQNLFIGNIDKQGHLAQLTRISDQRLIMPPHTYRVLTTNPQIIATQYPDAIAGSFIPMARMPSYNNEEGHVILAYYQPGADSPEPVVLDSLHYTSSMHSPFIHQAKGVSLERQNATIPTNTPGNFRSASILAGGATPGLRNSTSQQEKNRILLHSRIIHPYAQDASQQPLKIDYMFTDAALMANIRIFDHQGRLVRNLTQNKSIPSEGTWIWDGYGDHQQSLRTGIYTIVIEIYSAMGYRDVFRKSFVLTN